MDPVPRVLLSICRAHDQGWKTYNRKKHEKERKERKKQKEEKKKKSKKGKVKEEENRGSRCRQKQ